MALPNPFYIDALARHDASVLRGLAELASEGQEGVRGGTHLAIKALPTPGGAITCAPGLYSVENTAAGAAFENYVGKVLQTETISVSPTDSSGPRTDLVILRIENPNASGTGNWATPVDTLNGPYAYIRVIEGVPANIQSVKGWNDTWTALTLARITRPANTGIVTQAHITDLRSLIDLSVERIVIINNPPAAPPPIAQQYWTESTPCSNGDELLPSHTAWRDFPVEGGWDVPIPSWALGVDINCLVTPAVTGGNVYGEMRLIFGSESVGSVPTVFDENLVGSQIRPVMMIGGTESLEASLRGKVVRVKMQAHSLDSGSGQGKLKASRGCRINIWLNFKRYPVLTD